MIQLKHVKYILVGKIPALESSFLRVDTDLVSWLEFFLKKIDLTLHLTDLAAALKLFYKYLYSLCFFFFSYFVK